MEEVNILFLLERIEELEKNVLRLTHLIRFHGLDVIDRKYVKFNPKEGEYPFFEAKGFKSELPLVKPLSCINDNEIYEIKNLKEEDKQAALKRMTEYYKMREGLVVKQQTSEALSASSQKPECTQG